MSKLEFYCTFFISAVASHFSKLNSFQASFIRTTLVCFESIQICWCVLNQHIHHRFRWLINKFLLNKSSLLPKVIIVFTNTFYNCRFVIILQLLLSYLVYFLSYVFPHIKTHYHFSHYDTPYSALTLAFTAFISNKLLILLTLKS